MPSTAGKRPVAGGDSNARTNPTPAGTAAADLDAAVPQDKRQAAIQQQEQAEQVAAAVRRDAAKFDENPTMVYRSSLDDYYEQHPTYVDPTTNVVYAAEYDRATGSLTLTRDDEPTKDVPRATEEPVSPLSTRDDNYVPDAERSTADGGKKRDVKVRDDENHALVATDSDGTRSVGVDPAEGRTDTGSVFNPLGDQRPHVQDTVIVVAPDGSRVTTVNTALATEPEYGHDDLATSTVTHTNSEGTQTSRAVTTERTRIEDGGVVVQRTDSTSSDGRTTMSWQDHRVDPNGDHTTRETTRVTEGDEVVSDHRTAQANAGGVQISDSISTDYEDGKPTETTILRSAIVGNSRRTSRYEVGFDAEGYSTSLTARRPDRGGARLPEDEREPLDEWIQQQLGPVGADQTRPAFGLVSVGDTANVDGREVDNPVYVSEIGVRTSVDGVDVFVEGDSVAASQSLPDSVDALRAAWVGMPPKMQGAAHTIDLLQGRSNGDRQNSAKFASEFHAGASAGSTHMTYWLNDDPNVDLTRHEYGHLTGVNGGARDETAWDAAMAADRDSGIRESLHDVDPEDIHYITNYQPLLSDELGVTQYAEKHLDNNGNENDDWAESIAMYLSSREHGGVLQVRGDDGTVETYRFEELFPARAAILDSYYELGPAPEVAPPAFPEQAERRKGP